MRSLSIPYRLPPLVNGQRMRNAYAGLVTRVLRKFSIHVQIDLALRNRPQYIVFLNMRSRTHRIVIVFPDPLNQFTGSAQSDQPPLFAVEFPGPFIQNIIDIYLRGRYRSSVCPVPDLVDVFGRKIWPADAEIGFSPQKQGFGKPHRVPVLMRSTSSRTPGVYKIVAGVVKLHKYREQYLASIKHGIGPSWVSI